MEKSGITDRSPLRVFREYSYWEMSCKGRFRFLEHAFVIAFSAQGRVRGQCLFSTGRSISYQVPCRVFYGEGNRGAEFVANSFIKLSTNALLSQREQGV